MMLQCMSPIMAHRVISRSVPDEFRELAEKNL
jgi:hypothetical protein